MQTILKSLKDIGLQHNVSLNESDPSKPLPPASVQRFLMARSVPAVVITDHKNSFSNKYVYVSEHTLVKNVYFYLYVCISVKYSELQMFMCAIIFLYFTVYV